MRILLVDGQDEVRRGLRMRLEVEPDVDVIGETGRIEEALYLARALGPDVIVADIGKRGDEQWTLISRLRAMAPGAVLVALALRGDNVMRTQAQEAGVQAFLEKSGGGGDLLQAIRQLVENAKTESGPQMERNLRRNVSDLAGCTRNPD